MRLFHYQAKDGNFGDDLNSWLWPELLPDAWDRSDRTLFSGIGTIIGNPMPPAKRIIVFTSGIGYRPPPADWGSPRWQVLAVRGPLTARVLGLDERLAVTDGAALLATLARFHPLDPAERHGTMFVPHFEMMPHGRWDLASSQAGVTLLDPRGDPEQVIQAIRRSALVLADSMHAAIVADTMRVPWVPLASSNGINGFKWLDWTLSLDLQWEPVRLPSISRRLGYLNLVRPLFGEAHLTAPTAEAALRAYRRFVRRDASPVWQAIRPKLKHHLAAAPDRLRFAADRAGADAREDRRAIDAVASTLSKAAGRPGFLSTDRSFNARLEMLQERLASLKTSGDMPAGRATAYGW